MARHSVRGTTGGLRTAWPEAQVRAEVTHVKDSWLRNETLGFRVDLQHTLTIRR